MTSMKRTATEAARELNASDPLGEVTRGLSAHRIPRIGAPGAMGVFTRIDVDAIPYAEPFEVEMMTEDGCFLVVEVVAQDVHYARGAAVAWARDGLGYGDIAVAQ